MDQPIFSAPSPLITRWHAVLRALAWFSLLALVFTPLVVDYAARDDAFMGPKWAWIAIFTAFGLAVAGARALAGRALVLPLGEVWVAALLFMLWHWVACLWAPSASLAVERAGRITWLTLALLLGFQVLITRRHLLLAARLAFGVALATALWVLVEDAVRAWWPTHVWIKPNLPDWRGYISAGLGNTNHLGDLLSLALLGGLAAFGSARGAAAWAWGASLAVITAALIVCFSVGSNLGLIVGALVMLALMLHREGLRWFTGHAPRWIALLAVWAGLLLLFNTDNPLNPHRPGILTQGFASGRWQEGGPTRLAIWAQTLEMIRQHSLLGAGTGNFTFLFPTMQSALVADRPDLLVYQGMWTNAAHNELLQAWAELGIGGLALLLAVVAVAFFALLKNLAEADEAGARIRIALAGMLAAFVAHGQMNFVLQHPAGALTLFALLLAVLVEKRARPERAGMPPLQWESGPLALRVDWQSMDKPTAIGAALLLPDLAAIGLGVLLFAAAAACVPGLLAPVRAQREYRLALATAEPARREAHYQRALELEPDAHDVRSSYSQWLLEQGRAADCLEQMPTLRLRLNSNELYMREAQALHQLGREDEAEAALATLHELTGR